MEAAKERYDRLKAEGRCPQCGGQPEPDKIVCKSCVSPRCRTPEKRRQTNQKLKKEVFEAYGGGKCNCCGEAELRFLTLDHVNNDGNVHRRVNNMKSGGQTFYYRLRTNGFPNDPPLQVLCYNCNNGKRVNGGVCPHKESI